MEMERGRERGGERASHPFAERLELTRRRRLEDGVAVSRQPSSQQRSHHTLAAVSLSHTHTHTRSHTFVWRATPRSCLQVHVLQWQHTQRVAPPVEEVGTAAGVCQAGG